jgi:hypothetical protein
METLKEAQQALVTLLADSYYKEYMAHHNGSYHEFDDYNGRQFGIISCCHKIGVSSRAIKMAYIKGISRGKKETISRDKTECNNEECHEETLQPEDFIIHYEEIQKLARELYIEYMSDLTQEDIEEETETIFEHLVYTLLRKIEHKKLVEMSEENQKLDNNQDTTRHIKYRLYLDTRYMKKQIAEKAIIDNIKNISGVSYRRP